MFVPISVNLADLLLDPNNPRCVTSLAIEPPVPDDAIEPRQEKLLQQFNSAGSSEFFDIKDLLQSFQEVGYVPIDKLVVRRLPTGKFLVLEGNRRVTALKILQRRFQNGEAIREDLIQAMDSLPVMEITAAGLTREELQRRIAVLLGIRHHGSLLEWEPLPKAYNIYKTYMSKLPKGSQFVIDARGVAAVAGMLSIPAKDVRQGLKTYVVFRQLRDTIDGVRDRHFSLVQSGISNSKLVTHGFFKIDERSHLLDEPSVQRMEQVCQFRTRDGLNSSQKIIPRPQDFSVLGKLVDRAHTSESEAVRSLAKRVLAESMSGELDPDSNDLKQSVQGALDDVVALESRTEWLGELKRLLQKQQDELDVEGFHGLGNELMELERVNKSLGRLRRILDL